MESVAILGVGFAFFRLSFWSNLTRFLIIGFINSSLYIFQTEYTAFGEYAFPTQIIIYIMLVSSIYEMRFLDSFFTLVAGFITVSLFQVLIVGTYMEVGLLNRDTFQTLLQSRALVQGSEVILCSLVIYLLHKYKLGFLYKRTESGVKQSKQLYLLLNGSVILSLIIFQLVVAFASIESIFIFVGPLGSLALLYFIVLYLVNKQLIFKKHLTLRKKVM